ncbi:MAG: hypothetical protein R3325_05660 [Thermoanaerobaculia bacterium]|nr:hypothetical protein [Thermoanaerobaculia bacterium]
MPGYAIRRPVANVYLVRQRDRRRLRELLQVLGVTLALGACGVAYVWLHVELVRSGYRVDGLEIELREAERQKRLLLLDAEYLERPERIRRRAVEELGMVPVEPGAVLFAEEP